MKLNFLILALFLFTGSPKLNAELNKEIEIGFQKLNNPTSDYFVLNFHETIKQLPPDHKKAAVVRLKEARNSSHPEVRRSASLTLHNLGDNSGVPILIQDIQTLTNHNLRGNVAVALRIIKDNRSIPALIAATEDPSPYVRTIALHALGEMKATNALSTIINKLDDSEFEKGSCLIFTPGQAACSALGELGDTNGIASLVHLIEKGKKERPHNFVDAHLALWKLQGKTSKESRALYFKLIGKEDPELNEEKNQRKDKSTQQAP